MLQNDGEPAWQGKTYNALKDKKHLTGINKEGRLKKRLFLPQIITVRKSLVRRMMLRYVYN